MTARRHISRAARTLLLAVLVVADFASARAQILFQQFYYPIDNPPAGSSWWKQSAEQSAELARLGVTHVWHPVPAKGGSGARSMGYDPYDLYDLGSKNQKGSIPTRFGTRDEFLEYVARLHANGLRVVTDVVLNHGGGADFAEDNLVMARLRWDDIPDDSSVPASLRFPGATNLRSWTRFQPRGANGKPGAGRFPRDWRHFHPSVENPNRRPPYNERVFLEDYDPFAQQSYVGTQLIRWADWYRAQTGVDGFRLDAVKLVDPAYLDRFAVAQRRIPAPGGGPFFLVGEFWDGTPAMAAFAGATHRQMQLFDFPLYYALRDMTSTPGTFSMRQLWERRYPNRDEAVTFVSNHDVDRENPIDRQKRLLPYAIILMMSGMPSIFHLDYFRSPDPNLPKALRTLVPLARRYARGSERERWLDDDILVLDREQSGILAIYNDGGSNRARTVTVDTSFPPGTNLRVVASSDNATEEIQTDSNGKARLTAPPAGFRWYVRASDFPVNPTVAAPSMQTTQIWEFADDLDTGKFGGSASSVKSVRVYARLGSRIAVSLYGLSGSGQTRIDLLRSGGSVMQSIVGKRGHTPTVLTVASLPASERYTVRLYAPGAPSTAKARIVYTAPR